jgi:hypothetical protein
VPPSSPGYQASSTAAASSSARGGHDRAPGSQYHDHRPASIECRAQQALLWNGQREIGAVAVFESCDLQGRLFALQVAVQPHEEQRQVALGHDRLRLGEQRVRRGQPDELDALVVVILPVLNAQVMAGAGGELDTGAAHVMQPVVRRGLADEQLPVEIDAFGVVPYAVPALRVRQSEHVLARIG